MTAPTLDLEGLEARAVDLDVKPSRTGRRLDGYVALFRSRTRIADHNGDFDEELHPGFADRSLRENGLPVMQFDHGRDPRIGTVPVGRWTEWRADGKGYRVRGHLLESDVVEPLRVAIADGAVSGLSFRFKVAANGDRWERRGGGADLRHVMDADVHEAGPVVFPAYAGARVSSSGLADVVERHYDDEEDEDVLPPVGEVVRMLEEITGLTEQRIADRTAAKAERRQVNHRAHREHLLELARGERRARREAEAAYAAWRAPWRAPDDMARYLAASRRAQEFREQLAEDCLYDEELVSAIRRRVAA